MKKQFRNYKHKRLIKQIISLCFEVNAKTNYAAFFSASGHVSGFDVEIKQSKNLYQTSIFRCWTFASDKNLLPQLKNAKTTLENLLKENKS